MAKEEFSGLDFVRKLPEWVVPEICQRDGLVLLLLWNKAKDLHVSTVISPGADLSRDLSPMLNNLAGAIWEREHPGILGGMIRREAKAAAADELLEINDCILWLEYHELHKNFAPLHEFKLDWIKRSREIMLVH